MWILYNAECVNMEGHAVPGSSERSSFAAATDGCRRGSGGGIDCAAEIIVIVNAAFC
jgi:hypothetical protein